MLPKNQMVGVKERVTKALEWLFTDTATVYCRQKVRNAETGITSTEDTVLYANIPCRLSYKTGKAANDGKSADGLSQQIRLFVAPDINIPAGAVIAVVRQGIETRYKNSGEPVIYATHREINLELEREYA